MSLCCFGSSKSWKRDHSLEDSSAEVVTGNVRLFSYNELRSATRNFHPTNKVGGGGFGVVYSGVLRDETQVAIKSLSAESKQGTREFLTEIEMISNIRHTNLVQLIGCCVERNNRMLVYEYLENNSLAYALFGPMNKRAELGWPIRAAICVGTAQGLAFLHEDADPPIVHRDIKASNVLLDKDFVPKIGDFGLAKLFPDNVTHISTRVAGTMGYLAPEYALLGQLTRRADIYSFGVLMLEIISGRSSSKAAWGDDMFVLLEWTWKLREQGRLLEVVDPDMEGYPEDEVLRFIKVALFCTQAASQQRPSMRQVIEMLSSEQTLDESALTAPGILKFSSKESGSSGSSSQSTRPKKAKSFSGSSQLFATSDANSVTQLEPR